MTFNEKFVLDDNTCSRSTIDDKYMRDSASTDGSSPKELSRNVNNSSEQNTSTEPFIIDITKLVPEEEKHLVRQAGQGGAVLGFIFGGPIGSALLGFGSAYAVRKKDCTIGDTARSLGELTISIKEKAYAVEEKHQFVKRSKTTIGSLCGDNENENVDENENEIENGNSNIAFKTRAFVDSSWLAASRFTKENQLVERGVEGTGKGIEYIDSAISSFRGKNESVTDKSD